MEPFVRLCLSAVLLMLSVDLGSGLRKSWRLSWNLDDDANWSGGSVACPGQHLKFPQRLDYATYLSSSLRVEKLTLPRSGEIVFGEKGQLEVGGGWQRPSHCGALPSAVTWSHTGRDEWWDSRAWFLPHELQANESAIPDLSRIPCTTDTVVLRPYPKYLSPIHLTEPAVRVESVEVNGQRLTTSGVLDYAARNVSGQLTGRSLQAGALLYAEQDPLCLGGTDCVCAARGQASFLHQVVCRHRRQRCPAPLCDNPITMRDFCCPQCGVDFALAPSFSGDRRRLEGLLSSLDGDAATEGVARYVGLMTDLRYHVYVVPRDEKGDYAAVADMVAKILDEASSGPLNVTAAGLSAYKKRVSATGVRAGVISGFIIVALLAALLYYIHTKGYARTLLRSESPVSFQFRRMSMVAIRRLSRIPLHADVLSSRRASDAQSGRTPDSGPVPSYSVQTGGLRFMNPVFSKSTASLAAMPIDPEGGLGNDQDEPSRNPDEVENPMYGAFMHMTCAEKQAYDESNLDLTQGPPKPPRLEEKGQGVVRFSQLGTIDEDVQSTEDDANEILADCATNTARDQPTEADTHTAVTTIGEEVPSLAEYPPTDADLPERESGKDNTHEDTKIVIEVHQTRDEQLEAAERDELRNIAGIEIPELPTVEQLQGMKDDGATGINFGYEDDEGQ